MFFHIDETVFNSANMVTNLKYKGIAEIYSSRYSKYPINFNISSNHCCYSPRNYSKLTNKLEKQKPAFSGVPALSCSTTYNNKF